MPKAMNTIEVTRKRVGGQTFLVLNDGRTRYLPLVSRKKARWASRDDVYLMGQAMANNLTFTELEATLAELDAKKKTAKKDG